MITRCAELKLTVVKKLIILKVRLNLRSHEPIHAYQPATIAMKLSAVILAVLSIGATSIAAQETPSPTPATSTPQSGCTEVSVDGDATFCIEGPICSGSGDQPAGTNCPKIGDKATADCWDYVPSYADAQGCVAPVNAECKPIEAGTWGCVWAAGSESGSGMGEAGSSSASGSGSGATITIPVNATSMDAENPEDIQFPKNLKATTLSADVSSSATSASTGPIVGIVAAVAGIVCAVAAAAFYRRKQLRREEATELADAVQTPPRDGRSNGRTGYTPLTPPLRDQSAFFAKTNV